MSSSTVPSSTQVLIAGGGPVGLATAIELSRRGVEFLVVEPREQVSHARPRCKTINVRTMQHLRRWGVADRFRALAPLPISYSQEIVFCTSLTGYELSRFHGVLGLEHDGDRFPELGQQAPQYVIEELFREVVAELPGPSRLLTGSRVNGVRQDAGGCRVTVADAAGRESVIAADYVVGADGPRSVVRAAIGSSYVGEHALRPNFGMVFTAPELAAQVVHGPAIQYWVVNPQAPALMGPLDLDGTWWLIAFGVEQEVGERDAQLLIDGVAGRPVQSTVLSTDPWTARMQIVDRARDRRVFLVGDAAHLNPPFGGHGLNTGVGDAVDIAWKLAAVIGGWASPTLLDSYELERRPIQTEVIAAAEANMRVLATELLSPDLASATAAGDRARSRADREIQATKHAEFHALDLVLDLGYDGSTVIAAGGGRLLDHAWLDDGRSVYDALGPDLTLLICDGVEDDAEAAFSAAAAERSLPLEIVRVNSPRLREKSGAALLLVRPDQYVAWSGLKTPADPGAVLDLVSGRLPAPAGSLTSRV